MDTGLAGRTAHPTLGPQYVSGFVKRSTYYPALNPNEGFRKISVEIVTDIGKKYRVRARPGYRPRGGF